MAAASNLTPPADGEYFAAAHEGGGRQVIYLWECEAEARLNAVLEAQRWVRVGAGCSVEWWCWGGLFMLTAAPVV